MSKEHPGLPQNKTTEELPDNSFEEEHKQHLKIAERRNGLRLNLATFARLQREVYLPLHEHMTNWRLSHEGYSQHAWEAESESLQRTLRERAGLQVEKLISDKSFHYHA